MQPDLGRRVLQCLALSGEFLFGVLEFGQSGPERIIPGTVLDGAQHAGELAIDLLKIALHPNKIAASALAEGGKLLVERFDEFLDQLWCQHVLTQAAQHTRLDMLAHDGPRVFARALASPRGAAIAIARDDGVAAAATPALQQPAQQEMRPMRGVQAIAGGLPALKGGGRLARLRGVP